MSTPSRQGHEAPDALDAVTRRGAGARRRTRPRPRERIESASHVDLYDKEQHVAPALEQLTTFFTTNINA
jgi:hypothetical protein